MPQLRSVPLKNLIQAKALPASTGHTDFIGSQTPSEGPDLPSGSREFFSLPIIVLF